MDVLIRSGSIQEVDADAIVVNLFEGVTEPGGATGAVDKALDGTIRDLVVNGESFFQASNTTSELSRLAKADGVLDQGALSRKKGPQ